MSRQFFLVPLAIAMGLAVLVGCLQSDDQVDSEVAEIVGGSTTDITMLPWQVSLQSGGGYHFCGGTIVAPTWIVTAAHCVEGGAPARIMAGATRLSQGSSGQIVRVARALQMPGYSDVDEGKDLALLELQAPLELNGTTVAAIKPVSGFFADQGIDAPGVMSVVSGWGSLSSNGSYPDSLQSVQVPIVSLADASNDYGFALTGDQLPAGVRGVGGRDSCQGDSGGPLVVADAATGAYRLAGVVSWGYGCADPDYPGIYARVSSMFDFIDARAGGLPSASAGADHRVDGRDEVILDASGSSDVGVGTIVGYEWTQLAGPTVELDQTGAQARFVAPNRAGDLTFQVTVVDDGGNTASDEIVVSVDVAFTPPGLSPPSSGELAGGRGQDSGGCASGGGAGGSALLLLGALGLLAMRRRRA